MGSRPHAPCRMKAAITPCTTTGGRPDRMESWLSGPGPISVDCSTGQQPPATAAAAARATALDQYPLQHISELQNHLYNYDSSIHLIPAKTGPYQHLFESRGYDAAFDRPCAMQVVRVHTDSHLPYMLRTLQTLR